MSRFAGDDGVIFEHACGLDYEGIVSKRLGSLYRSGRSKQCQGQEFGGAGSAARGGRELGALCGAERLLGLVDVWPSGNCCSGCLLRSENHHSPSYINNTAVLRAPCALST
jgi:hypothetical protein